MVEIVWTVRSYEHLHEIGEYIARDSPFQARRVVQSIIKEIKRIEYPHRAYYPGSTE